MIRVRVRGGHPPLSENFFPRQNAVKEQLDSAMDDFGFQILQSLIVDIQPNAKATPIITHLVLSGLVY